MQRPRPPSPSPSPSPSASPRRRSHARSYTSQSRSPRRSRRSTSRPPSRHSSRHARRRPSSRQQRGPNGGDSWEDRGRLIKDSAGLLLGIGVAAFVAHRFWPRGMLHGGKEEWETRLDRAADRIKDRLFGDHGHDHRDHRDPDVARRRERGRSRHRAYYESERLASRSPRERVPRGRSADPSRRSVYHEAVDTGRWERPAPGHHQQGRAQPADASERYADQRHVDMGGYHVRP